jgi:hypothetical protein
VGGGLFSGKSAQPVASNAVQTMAMVSFACHVMPDLRTRPVSVG